MARCGGQTSFCPVSVAHGSMAGLPGGWQIGPRPPSRLSVRWWCGAFSCKREAAAVGRRICSSSARDGRQRRADKGGGGGGGRRGDGSGGTGGQQDKDEPGVRAQLAQLDRRALKRPAGPWPVEGSDSGGDFLDEVHEAGIRTGSLQSHCTVRAQVRVSTRCSPGALDLSCWNLPSKLEGAHTGALSGGDRGPRVFPRDPDTLQAKSSGLPCPVGWPGGQGASVAARAPLPCWACRSPGPPHGAFCAWERGPARPDGTQKFEKLGASGAPSSTTSHLVLALLGAQ